jgi:hypothetical protein
MMLMGIESLKNDPGTKVIVVISKPPIPEVSEKVLKALEESGKPSVVHFIGSKLFKEVDNIYFAKSLEETAKIAVSLYKKESYVPNIFNNSLDIIKDLIQRETKELSGEQKYLRGIFTGGTLAQEALVLSEEILYPVYSNLQKDKTLQLKNPYKSSNHTIVDLGDDFYTLGHPHPMIDPATRIQRINKEGDDPTTAVLLLDIVLGFGSHHDPAGAILDSLKKAKEKAKNRGGYLPIVASVTGTSKDIQDYHGTIKGLTNSGCIVMPSNYQATLVALEIVKVAGRI